VYISLDVVFDESVYPFSQLHPNAGAQLRKSFELLPDHLKNLSPDFGNAHVLDQGLINANPANGVPSSSMDATGTILDSNGKEIQVPEHYFMRGSDSALPDNRGAGAEADSPRTAVTGPTAPSPRSVPDSGPPTRSAAKGASTQTAHAHQHRASDLSSTGVSTPHAPPVDSPTAATADPPAHDSPILSPAAVTGIPIVHDSMVSSRSSEFVGGSSTISPPPQPPHQYATCLRHGISKPKQYIDGTVR
jgi:hypothetical protein